MSYSLHNSLVVPWILFLFAISNYCLASTEKPDSETNQILEQNTRINQTPNQSALQTLYAKLAKAPDNDTAEQITLSIEKLWTVSGSSTADLLLARAIEAASSKNLDKALHFLNRLIEIYPNWPEAYNRRAYLFVLRQDYLQAQTDLRRVLFLDPQNFRALEGLVQVLNALGQKKAALDTNRELLKIHPFSPGAKEILIRLEDEVKNQGI